MSSCGIGDCHTSSASCQELPALQRIGLPLVATPGYTTQLQPATQSTILGRGGGRGLGGGGSGGIPTVGLHL